MGMVDRVQKQSRGAKADAVRWSIQVNKKPHKLTNVKRKFCQLGNLQK